MKIRARNVIKGKIVAIKKGATTAHIRIDIGGQTLTASITNESADELKLEKGKMTDAPVRTRFGFHVIRLEDVREFKFPALAEVKHIVRGTTPED